MGSTASRRVAGPHPDGVAHRERTVVIGGLEPPGRQYRVVLAGPRSLGAYKHLAVLSLDFGERSLADSQTALSEFKEVERTVLVGDRPQAAPVGVLQPRADRITQVESLREVCQLIAR